MRLKYQRKVVNCGRLSRLSWLLGARWSQTSQLCLTEPICDCGLHPNNKFCLNSCLHYCSAELSVHL